MPGAILWSGDIAGSRTGLALLFPWDVVLPPLPEAGGLVRTQWTALRTEPHT